MSDNIGVKLHQTMDANTWAEEFIKLNNSSDMDMMRSWFANSIMCGWALEKSRYFDCSCEYSTECECHKTLDEGASEAEEIWSTLKS